MEVTAIWSESQTQEVPITFRSIQRKAPLRSHSQCPVLREGIGTNGANSHKKCQLIGLDAALLQQCSDLHGSEVLPHLLRDPRHEGELWQQQNLTPQQLQENRSQSMLAACYVQGKPCHAQLLQ